MSEFKADDEIHTWSNPTIAQRKLREYLGADVPLLRSKQKNKKYAIRVHGKLINFGEMRYSDYTKHMNKDRRDNYLARANAIRGEWRNDKFSPNNLAINVLW